MKKLLFLVALVVITACSYAQETSGQGGTGFRRGGGGNPQMKQEFKTRLMTQLHVTDAQADSIANAQFMFMRTRRGIEQETGLSEDDRKKRMSDAKKTRNETLKSILNEEQLEQLEDIMKNMRKEREAAKGSDEKKGD